MRGKLLLTIGDSELGNPEICFNMENETEKDFFYKMQEFLLNKGLKISLVTVTGEQKGERS